MSKESPTIMVVEDEELLLRAITQKLKLSNFGVISCESVRQAIDYLNTLPELPDAIWLDYYLKDSNGLEFMKQIRENKKWEKIPVVVVSNSASPDKVSTMLALGVKKYLLKAEYKLSDIIETFRAFINENESIK